MPGKNRNLILPIGAIVCCSALSAVAQTPAYRSAWSDAAVVQRIEAGIHANRMGWTTLRVVDSSGKPLAGAKVAIEQTRHDFLFGANLFMLGGFPTGAENQKFEQQFTALFNFGTVPFYWKTLEPKPGQLRFASSSEPIFRRPPPDTAVEFSHRTGVTLKGHPLVWDNPTWQHPDWAPQDPAELDRLMRQRIEQIAGRYRETIPIWDVVNEVFYRNMKVPMPRDFVYRAFQTAARVFPADTKLTLNEANNAWTNFADEHSPFYLLIQNLLLRGAAVNAIGLQAHFWHSDIYEPRSLVMRPLDLLRVLDRYSDFRLPIHITEITVPTPSGSTGGEAEQAEITRNLYRLWFSHPSVEAITWWNMVDNTAAPGEDKWLGGLLHRDLSPKLSYEALRKLIQEEWHTKLERSTTEQGELRFQGFYGKYRATIQHEGKTHVFEFSISKGGINRPEIRL